MEKKTGELDGRRGAKRLAKGMSSKASSPSPVLHSLDHSGWSTESLTVLIALTVTLYRISRLQIDHGSGLHCFCCSVRLRYRASFLEECASVVWRIIKDIEEASGNVRSKMAGVPSARRVFASLTVFKMLKSASIVDNVSPE
jgi:hypothetical protein